LIAFDLSSSLNDASRSLSAATSSTVAASSGGAIDREISPDNQVLASTSAATADENAEVATPTTKPTIKAAFAHLKTDSSLDTIGATPFYILVITTWHGYSFCTYTRKPESRLLHGNEIQTGNNEQTTTKQENVEGRTVREVQSDIKQKLKTHTCALAD
jgi:hypothetical protein